MFFVQFPFNAPKNVQTQTFWRFGNFSGLRDLKTLEFTTYKDLKGTIHLLHTKRLP